MLWLEYWTFLRSAAGSVVYLLGNSDLMELLMNPLDLLLPDSCRVVFLDMDHTLVDSDSDVSWKAYLAAQGLGGIRDRIGARWYYFQYRRNRLDIAKFCRFQFRQFRGKTPEQMRPLLDGHFREMVVPRIYRESRELVGRIQKSGREAVLLTATAAAIAAPTAKELGFEHCIGTVLDIKEGVYTGDKSGTYCGGPGKIGYMDSFLKERGLDPGAASYWGDSTADIPVLEAIGFPVAANPAPGLLKAAGENGWPVVSFTGG